MEGKKAILNSEVCCDEHGRQYHISLAPGEMGEYIIMVGDFARAEKYAKLFFDELLIEKHNREFASFTGMYKGLKISVMGTGISTSNTEIAMVEIFQITENPTFLRIGTSGGLQEYIDVADFVISTGAVRLENTSTYFVPENYPAISNHEVNLALIAQCEENNFPYHLGLTATASGFYGAQGRNIPGIPIRYPNLQDDLSKLGISNLEMEASTLLTLASLKKFRASAICIAINNRQHGTFATPEQMHDAEINIGNVGFEAMLMLSKMDEIKKTEKKKNWYPEIDTMFG